MLKNVISDHTKINGRKYMREKQQQILTSCSIKVTSEIADKNKAYIITVFEGVYRKLFDTVSWLFAELPDYFLTDYLPSQVVIDDIVFEFRAMHCCIGSGLTQMKI